MTNIFLPANCQIIIYFNSTKNDFFIQHFNVRSLPKNKEKIEEFVDGITRFSLQNSYHDAWKTYITQ